MRLRMLKNRGRRPRVLPKSGTVIADAENQLLAVDPQRQFDPCAVSSSVLGRVLQGLGATVVDRLLDGAVQPLDRLDVHDHRARRPMGQLRKRRSQPLLQQQPRRDAMRQFAQLMQGGIDVGAGFARS
jgi:hypothetical protein